MARPVSSHLALELQAEGEFSESPLFLTVFNHPPLVVVVAVVEVAKVAPEIVAEAVTEEANQKTFVVVEGANYKEVL